MLRIVGRVGFAGVVALGMIAPALAADRTAEEIGKEIDAIKTPSTAAIQAAKGEEQQKLIQAYIAEMKKVEAKRSELAVELSKVDPENARLATLLPARWMSLAQSGKSDAALAEINDVLAKTKNAKLKTEALFSKVRVTMLTARNDTKAALPAIEEFLKAEPTDPRGGQLLYMMSSSAKDSEKAALEDRILKDYPKGQFASMILGARKQKESVGKPFELEFTDVTKGTTVAMKDLKGKVVVIDFWATWCGPCVAEMPNMKKLYAEYKDKGVEFIGVSLDQPKESGGLDELKKFVDKEQISWPQYYDGKVDARTFATNWGITAIPTVFIIDTEGNLFSTEARGQLEKLIPELLKKKVGTAGQ